MSGREQTDVESWRGQLPAGWSIQRLGLLGTFVKGRGGSKEDNRDAGIPVVRYGDLYTKFDVTIAAPAAFVGKADIARYTPLPRHSIVFAASGESAEEIGKSAVSLLDGPAVVGGDTVVLHPSGEVDPLYLAYALESAPLRAYKAIRSTGFTVVHISAGRLKTLPIPVPPLDEQCTIANYLDRETARIDTLIEEQQRLVDMLRERRWAVVERSVALLDWNTPFKAVAILIQTGPFGSQLKSDEYEEGGTPIINPSHIVAGEILPDPRIAVSAEKARALARHAFEEGDLVAARRGDLGRCAVVGPSATGFLCGTGPALLRLDRTVVDPLFASLVFSSRRNRDALSLASVGSTMDNLNSDIIGSLRVPIPTLEKQRQVVVLVGRATAKIDTLISDTVRFIELARERRSALITAAVTGQIDVRAVA